VSTWFAENYDKAGPLKGKGVPTAYEIPKHLKPNPPEPKPEPKLELERAGAEPTDLETIGAAVHILAKLLTGALSQAIAEGIAGAAANPKVAEALARALHPETRSPVPIVMTPAPEPVLEDFKRLEPGKPRNRLPRILVAGMKPNQSQVVTKAFQGRADFRFWESSEAIDQLKRMAEHVDAAVGMTSFLGHPADQALRARVPIYIAYQGGVTTVKNGVEKALRRLAGYKE
jgi:hypothetical protein